MADAPDINVDELRRRARRRLIGAVVLALAAAVIVPMLLESDPKPLGEDVSVKIPPEDSDKFVNRLSDKGAKTSTAAPAGRQRAGEGARQTGCGSPCRTRRPSRGNCLPIVPPPKKSIATGGAEDAGRIVQARAARPAVAPGAAAAPRPRRACRRHPAPAAKCAAPATVTPPKTPAPKEGFSVQLAAFADDKGANALANKLKKARLPRLYGTTDDEQGHAVARSRRPVPFARSAIEIRDKLKSEGYSGIVAAAK